MKKRYFNARRATARLLHRLADLTPTHLRLIVEVSGYATAAAFVAMVASPDWPLMVIATGTVFFTLAFLRTLQHAHRVLDLLPPARRFHFRGRIFLTVFALGPIFVLHWGIIQAGFGMAQKIAAQG